MGEGRDRERERESPQAKEGRGDWGGGAHRRWSKLKRRGLHVGISAPGQRSFQHHAGFISGVLSDKFSVSVEPAFPPRNKAGRAEL